LRRSGKRGELDTVIGKHGETSGGDHDAPSLDQAGGASTSSEPDRSILNTVSHHGELTGAVPGAPSSLDEPGGAPACFADFPEIPEIFLRRKKDAA
jgi:hypothetical protein